MIVLNGKDKHPYSFTDIQNRKERDTHEQSYEIAVIFATDTVIQELAVMIEIFSTATTPVTVIARLMNQMFALFTIYKQLMSFGSVVLIDEEPIDRVGAGQIEIIQNNFI